MLPKIDPLGVVVVCEDDAATLELLCDHLRADRFDVVPAPSAADALRHCQYRSPDLLLLDLVLPDASGSTSCARSARPSETTGRYDSGLPVIVLSGRTSEVDRVRGLEEGADDYVAKRFITRSSPPGCDRCFGADPTAAGAIRIGDSIDSSRREVIDGERVTLATASTSCCSPWPPSRAGCSPSRSFCATSGTSRRWAAPGRSTRTRAGCGASSTPRAAASCRTCGAPATACCRHEHPARGAVGDRRCDPAGGADDGGRRGPRPRPWYAPAEGAERAPPRAAPAASGRCSCRAAGAGPRSPTARAGARRAARPRP